MPSIQKTFAIESAAYTLKHLQLSLKGTLKTDLLSPLIHALQSLVYIRLNEI